MATPTTKPNAATDEISAPALSNGNDTQVAPSGFTAKLRAAITALQPNEYIDVRTAAERQQVSNLVGQVAKKVGVKFETSILRKRNEDPEGKLALRIKRTTTPLPVKGAAPAAAVPVTSAEAQTAG